MAITIDYQVSDGCPRGAHYNLTAVVTGLKSPKTVRLDPQNLNLDREPLEDDIRAALEVITWMQARNRVDNDAVTFKDKTPYETMKVIADNTQTTLDPEVQA